jgi:hypothetical protein
VSVERWCTRVITAYRPCLDRPARCTPYPRLTDRLTDRMTDRMTHRMTDRMTDVMGGELRRACLPRRPRLRQRLGRFALPAVRLSPRSRSPSRAAFCSRAATTATATPGTRSSRRTATASACSTATRTASAVSASTRPDRPSARGAGTPSSRYATHTTRRCTAAPLHRTRSPPL